MLLKKILVSIAALAAVAATAMTTASVAQAATTIPGTFNDITPTRILDTRAGVGAPMVKVAPRSTLTFNATSGLPGNVGSVALTVTAVAPTSTGWLTVYPSGVTKPLASTLNFTPGRNTPNSTIIDVGTGGNISIFNGSNGTVDVLADLTGWWTAGTVSPDTVGALNTMTPARILDTRDGAGTPAAALSTTVVPVAGVKGVPATGVSAVAANLTVTESTAAGYLSADSEVAQPDARTSNLNFQTNTSRANLVLLLLNPDGTVSVFNGSKGTAHIVIDVLGYFNASGDPAVGPSVDGAFVPTTSYRAVDTRVEGSPGSMEALSTRKLAVLPADVTFAFKAVAVTVTAVNAQAAGFFTVWDGLTGLPPTSNSNFLAGQNVAATTILPINPDGTVTVYNGSYGNLDIIIDVNGFVLNDLTAPPGAKAKANATKSGNTVVTDAIARARAWAAAKAK